LHRYAIVHCFTLLPACLVGECPLLPANARMLLRSASRAPLPTAARSIASVRVEIASEYSGLYKRLARGAGAAGVTPKRVLLAVLAGGYVLYELDRQTDLTDWKASVKETPSTYASALKAFPVCGPVTKEQLKSLAILHLNEHFSKAAFVPITDALDTWCEVMVTHQGNQRVADVVERLSGRYVEQLYNAKQIKVKNMARFKQAVPSLLAERIESTQHNLSRLLTGPVTRRSQGDQTPVWGGIVLAVFCPFVVALIGTV